MIVLSFERKGSGIKTMKKNGNSGFTLMEVVLAIAVLAIILTPVMDSFITSSKVNIKSRKLLMANDVAHTVMESFKDKNYDDIRDILGGGSPGSASISDSSLSGGNALLSISENFFNDTDHAEALDFSSKVTACKKDEFSYFNGYGTLTVSTSSLVSGNNPSNFSGYDICNDFTDMVVTEQGGYATAMSSNSATYYYSSPSPDADTDSGEFSAVTFANVPYDGYNYDITCVFYPTCSTKDDQYYTYGMSLCVYNLQDMAVMGYVSPTVTYFSGMRKR